MEKVDLEKILEKRGLLKKEKILENILKDEKFLTISKIVLASLLISGVLTIAVAAPGVLKGLSLFFPKRKYTSYKKEDLRKIKSAFYSLKFRKLIILEKSKQGLIIKLTEKGKERALKCYLKAISLKYKKWDERWRIVIFDIPTKLNRKRDALREFLKHMGFKELQKSIYISPYRCREELEAILEYLQLKPYVKFLEVDFLEEEELFKKKFKL